MLPQPYVLPSVHEAERRIHEKEHDHEYLPIHGASVWCRAHRRRLRHPQPPLTSLVTPRCAGDATYIDLALKLCYGAESDALKSGKVAAVQTISGTGALRTAGEFIRRFCPEGTPLYLSNPTWANHATIFGDIGLEVRNYTYYNADTIALDFEGMVKDLSDAPDCAAVLLHTCAHNPTGIDPTREQWMELCDLALKKQFVCMFDNAYQGFASGDPEVDAFSLRYVSISCLHRECTSTTDR